MIVRCIHSIQELMEEIADNLEQQDNIDIIPGGMLFFEQLQHVFVQHRGRGDVVVSFFDSILAFPL